MFWMQAIIPKEFASNDLGLFRRIAIAFEFPSSTRRLVVTHFRAFPVSTAPSMNPFIHYHTSTAPLVIPFRIKNTKEDRQQAILSIPHDARVRPRADDFSHAFLTMMRKFPNFTTNR